MSERIVITSGKGGVGKSTVAAGLGIALSKLDKKVLLIDCDAGGRTLDILLKVSQSLIFDLGDILNHRAEIGSALLKSGLPGLHVIAAPSKVEDITNFEYFRDITNALTKIYDYILIDSPAGIDSAFKLAVSGADRAIVVTNVDKASKRFALNVVKILAAEGMPARLIVNRLKPSRKSPVFVDIDEIINELQVQLIGILPEDERYTIAENNPSDIFPPPLSDAFLRIAKRLNGEYVKIGIGRKY